MRARIVRLQDRINQAARAANTHPEVITRDFTIGFVLGGIAAHPTLADTLIFKGGTALKKVFFQNYRFSEDLDYSATRSSPRGVQLEAALHEAMAETERLLGAYGQCTVRLDRVKQQHPREQERFRVFTWFPWSRSGTIPTWNIKIEVTVDEIILLNPEKRPVLTIFGEDLEAQVLTYRIEEIVAEKMRTLLQTHEKLVTRGWNRPRARDYYDLWRILRELTETMDRACLPELLAGKCAHRSVTFTCLADFFTDQLVTEAQTHWDASLRPFVRDLPECGQLLTELRAVLRTFFPGLT